MVASRIVLVACLPLLLAGLAGSAAGATWTGDGASDRWSDPANWGGAVPAADEDVVFGGGRRQTCDIDAPDARVRTLTIAADGVVLTGARLTITRSIVQSRGANRIACALVIPAELACDITGELTIAAAISGDGGLTKSGVGTLVVCAANSYGGATTVRRGTLRIACDDPGGREGACGSAASLLSVDGGAIEVDTPLMRRPITVGRRGARMIARGAARTIVSRIATPEDVGCLSASFFAGSLREQRQDDWRTTRPPAGTRSDSVLNFPYAEHALFPTADAQRAAGIPGNDSGYATYSVQWDGFVAVPVGGTRLFALTSDGCRVAIDRDHDGVNVNGEWSQDAWGGGHDPPLLARLGAPLAAGVHPLRIQFEQTGNLGGFSLMWDDASHRAGMCQGRPVVPGEFLLGTGALEIGGDQAIRLEGTLSGASWLIKSGPSALTIAGADHRSGSTVVAAGSLQCGADQVLPQRALVVSAGATLALDGHGQTIGTLSGAGAIDLGAAVLSLGADDQSGTFAGAITGSGGIRKVGAGTALFDGVSSYAGRTDVSGGTLRRADGTIAVQVPLAAPITTIVALPTPPGDERVVDAWITVPPDAPPDLGVGAFIVDQHGRWFQRIDPERLPPGRSHRRFDLGAAQNLCSQPGLALWTALQATVATRAGLFFWSASASRCAIGIEGRVSGKTTPAMEATAPIAPTPAPPEVVPIAPTATTPCAPPRLCECASPSGPAQTGERWQVSVLPAPFPGNPYDSDEFALDAVITGPDHATITLPGFFEQPMRSSDRGDREDVVPAGGGHFTVRFRPRLPGRHQVRLTARWKHGGSVEAALPDVEVAGEPWDGYVHVDRADPRFFSIGGGDGSPGAFFWPVGISLRSINDVLSQRSMKTRLTPERGTLSYAAYLERFGRSGGTAAEIWMSSWNLALEWRGDWVGFYGPGRYNQDNAWRLDRILDLAWRNGVRINLVLHNHGQASDRDDHEWKDNPYNHDLGGVLTSPGQIFTDRRSLAAQEKLRRYIIARYADHPAVMGWKLWTEINLTASNPVALRAWHDQASARWHQLDVYQHPVTTHWSMDYHVADRAIIALKGIDYVCLDAYHDEGHPLASLLKEGMSPSGLGGIGKPVLVNEYGANWQGGSDAWMAADHAAGAWLSLVTGYGGSPMMWWYEWVDQKDRWAPYGAIARFLVGEDLRGSDAHGAACEATSAAGALTCLGWQRPGHLLGYVIDQQWGAHGTHDVEHKAARIRVGSSVSAGVIDVAWWDADLGSELRAQRIDHPGGDLWLDAPCFRRHLAFKLARAAK